MLGDYSKWTDPKVVEVGYFAVWQHHPLAPVNHIKELLTEEVLMFVGGLVRASLHSGLDAPLAPGRGAQFTRCIAAVQITHEPAGRVRVLWVLGNVGYCL